MNNGKRSRRKTRLAEKPNHLERMISLDKFSLPLTSKESPLPLPSKRGLPDRLKQSMRPQKQNNDHRHVGKNDGELRPNQYAQGLTHAKDQGPHQGPPHVPQ